jgi:hypothetical protein
MKNGWVASQICFFTGLSPRESSKAPHWTSPANEQMLFWYYKLRRWDENGGKVKIMPVVSGG